MRLSAAPVMPTIPVSNMGRAKRFYEGTLGLKPIKDFGDSMLLSAGATTLYLYQRPPTEAVHTLASFLVDDVTATVRELRSHGVAFENYDLPGLKTAGGIAEMPNGRSAWFKDPDGNILAVSDIEEAGSLLPQLKAARATSAADANKRLARRLWKEVGIEHNLDRLDRYYHKRVKYHGGAGEELQGLEALRAYLEEFFIAFPDMRVDIDDLVASGDRVTTRWTATGTHRGELQGMPATKKKVEMSGITIDRFRDGKIVEEWEQSDLLGMMQQLGTIST